MKHKNVIAITTTLADRKKSVGYMFRFNKNGNTKMGKIWSTSKLFGSDDYKIQVDGVDTLVKGTCGHFCDECKCKDSCYVAPSYRYDSVVKGHARNTIAMRTDIYKCFEDMKNQIDRAKTKPAAVRIDQSGEIESSEEFLIYCNLAKLNPDIPFYIYSKAYEYILPYICLMPANMTLLVSIWHESGIETWEKIKHLKNVKAFVLVDHEYTEEKYATMGINIQIMCGAYDENGKRVKDDKPHDCITCGYCFRGGVKVIGCFDHS